MNSETVPAELIEHIKRISALDATKAQHLVEEVLSFYQESVEHFVARRHRELQRQGLANLQIYHQIREELPERCFAAPVLSERQIRRMIYG